MITESKFLSKLWLEHVDGNEWILCAPLIYQSKLLNGIIVVPAGSTSDLASSPRIIRGVIPKSGKHNRADVLHDAGYRGFLQTKDGQSIYLIRPLCDKLFLEAMEVDGVGGKLRKIMYKMVSMFARKKGNLP